MKYLLKFFLVLAAALALCLTAPPSMAEVITKGGSLLLRPQPRETANFAFTNGIANPGLPLILRVTTWQGTNHFGIQTNGVPAVVGLGTNYIGFTGSINTTNNNGVANLGVTLFFKNGLLVTSNSVQFPNP